MSRLREPAPAAHAERLAERLIVGDGLASNPVPEWMLQAYSVFLERLLDPAYPCYFGTIAEKQCDLYYTYVEGGALELLPSSLSHFMRISRQRLKRRNNMAVFFEPEPVTLEHEGYRRILWQTLQFLHDRDPQPWPAGAPTNPEDPLWEFCFGGTPFFVFCAAPSYRKRRSRNMGPCLVVLFQPRDIFDGIEGNTPSGIQAREKVRRRLLEWDEVSPHPQMGFFGDPANNEWKHYFFPDDSELVTGKCPFSFTDNGG